MLFSWARNMTQKGRASRPEGGMPPGNLLVHFAVHQIQAAQLTRARNYMSLSSAYGFGVIVIATRNQDIARKVAFVHSRKRIEGVDILALSRLRCSLSVTKDLRPHFFDTGLLSARL
jgi:hypothetical protein